MRMLAFDVAHQLEREHGCDELLAGAGQLHSLPSRSEQLDQLLCRRTPARPKPQLAAAYRSRLLGKRALATVAYSFAVCRLRRQPATRSGNNAALP